MKKPRKHLLLPVNAEDFDLEFDDFYENLARNWEQKARKLQARRWRKMVRVSRRLTA